MRLIISKTSEYLQKYKLIHFTVQITGTKFQQKGG